MSTITATPDTATGSVALEITQTSPVTAVTRSNANGVSSVRVATGQLPSAASGTTIITDYEAAQGLNTYTAYVTDVAVKTNHIRNPSFEIDDVTWIRSGCTFTRGSYSQMAKSGTYQGTFSSDGTVAAPYAGVSTSTYRPAVTEGQWISFKAFTATETGGYQTRISFQFRDVAGAVLSTFYSAWVDAPFYTGITRSLSAVAPANAASVAYYVWFQDGLNPGVIVPSGKRLWVDAVNMGIGATQAEAEAVTSVYFDGSTADATDVDYAWTGTAHASTSTQATTTRQVSAAATLNLDKPWLLVPIAPNYSEQVESITDYSAGRETFSTVHRIIGRADPLVVMGKLGTRTGSLELWAANLEDANRLARVFDRGEAVLLKQTVAGMDMYLTATSLDVSPHQVNGADTRYRFTVAYQEVTRPYGDLAGALGWTFDALAAGYASFDAVTAAFATFDDLTLGDN